MERIHRVCRGSRYVSFLISYTVNTFLSISTTTIWFIGLDSFLALVGLLIFRYGPVFIWTATCIHWMLLFNSENFISWVTTTTTYKFSLVVFRQPLERAFESIQITIFIDMRGEICYWKPGPFNILPVFLNVQIKNYFITNLRRQCHKKSSRGTDERTDRRLLAVVLSWSLRLNFSLFCWNYHFWALLLWNLTDSNRT